MTQKRTLIWYRNDLRLHDHEPLYRSLEARSQPILLYCFDPRQFGKTSFVFPKTGNFRGQFLQESVADLRRGLQDLGSDLIVRYGKPEIVIPQLVKQLGINAVYLNEEVTSEETKCDLAVAAALTPLQVKLKRFWGSTLYHREDLPFAINDIPEVFTQFRKRVEKSSSIAFLFPTPQQLPPLPPEVETGEIPSLEDLGLTTPEFDSRGVMRFFGGEKAGKERVQQYFWQHDCLKEYKQTRNGMLGADYSSKFSPWLALGCLSPRYIYTEVERYEKERVKNNSTYWLIFELLWRDYFRFICAKHGNKIFHLSGLQGVTIPWKEDWKRFELWRAGNTGFPLVDANMRELAATGFMSNRGRQNVASFLTKNLGINWQMGAEWFESLLIDYDVCSNWGNWNYTAGVGNDARGFRYFNIPKQAKDYDAQGKYVKHWLPQLKQIPAVKVHEPYKLKADEQKRYDIRLGVDYPRPVVDLWQSVKTNEKIYNGALAKH